MIHQLVKANKFWIGIQNQHYYYYNLNSCSTTQINIDVSMHIHQNSYSNFVDSNCSIYVRISTGLYILLWWFELNEMIFSQYKQFMMQIGKSSSMDEVEMRLRP